MRWSRGSAAPMILVLLAILLTLGVIEAFATGPSAGGAESFPRSLDSYADSDSPGILALLGSRVRAEPFNLVATLIFLAAIVHTFLSSRFLAVSHRWTIEHDRAKAEGSVPRNSIHQRAELLHFLGEVRVDHHRRLLTAAAWSGLKPAPGSRLRRVFLHLPCC